MSIEINHTQSVVLEAFISQLPDYCRSVFVNGDMPTPRFLWQVIETGNADDLFASEQAFVSGIIEYRKGHEGEVFSPRQITTAINSLVRAGILIKIPASNSATYEEAMYRLSDGYIETLIDDGYEDDALTVEIFDGSKY